MGQHLSVELRTHLASHIVLGDELSPPSKAGVTSGLPCLDGIYMDPGDRNSGPHTYVTKQLNTEPSTLLILSFITFHEDETLPYLI